MAVSAESTTVVTGTDIPSIRLRGPEKPVSPKSTPEVQFPDIKTLRDAIPAHCFEPSTTISMSYLVRDLVFVGALVYAALTFIPSIPDANLRGVAWALYGFVQGLVCTGIWILGHEAGHGSFSRHPRLNDVVGFFTHSSLLVPFFSWKFSHHRHHLHTGHMEKDMTFVPMSRAQYLANVFKIDLLEDTPAYQFLCLVLHQLFGWATYLFLNVSAGLDSLQRKSSVLRRSHFDPTSAVFRPKEAPFIVLSDIGLCMTIYGLYLLSGVVGTQTVLLLYVQPYVWVHHWLIAITYLHHTHMDVPHYDAENWTYVKGALATVDREFGFVGRHLFHGIIEYHVIHHLFSRIPFYKAEEASNAIQPLLGNLYHRDDRSFLGQLWSTFTTCKFVEGSEAAPGVLHWVET